MRDKLLLINSTSGIANTGFNFGDKGSISYASIDTYATRTDTCSMGNSDIPFILKHSGDLLQVVKSPTLLPAGCGKIT